MTVAHLVRDLTLVLDIIEYRTMKLAIPSHYYIASDMAYLGM